MPPPRAPRNCKTPNQQTDLVDEYSARPEASCFNFDESRGGTLAKSWKYCNDDDEYPQ